VVAVNCILHATYACCCAVEGGEAERRRGAERRGGVAVLKAEPAQREEMHTVR